MFIRSKKDVDIYTRKIYAYVANTKGEKYIEFIQNLLNKKQVKYKIEEIFRIIVADIHDFLDKMNFCDFEIEINENLSVKEINESKYINDETFVEYALYKFEKSYSNDVNLKYLIKSILISIFDVNENFKYALRGKNKDADPRIKFLIAKYTDAKIKVTANVLRKIGVRVDKSMSIHRFAELYERYVENRINEFETEIKVNEEEIKLTHKDLLVFYYLSSFDKKHIAITIEEIARDCRISIATVSRAIKKLEKARKIKVIKKNNKNIYQIIDKKEIVVKKQQNAKIENIKYVENQKETKKKKKYNSKTKKKIDKSIEIPTSSLDFKKRTKGEKLDIETRYKLYLFRQKYKDELQNVKLSRLSRDNLLFFLINTEKFAENETLTLNKILKIIKYADSNPTIRNPAGWLIARFMICQGRFYFLLNNKKPKSKQPGKMESFCENSHEKSTDNIKQKRADKNKKDIYINGDLAYFIQKYNIPENEILSYLSRFKGLHGDVSYIVERYVANKIWKNLPNEERQKLIKYAQREIKRFAVLPKSKEEFQEEIRSIIFTKIKSDYLTLSIQERLRLQMSGQT